MGHLANLFDSYNQRARLSPALLTILPISLYALLQLPHLLTAAAGQTWVGFTVPFLIVCGIPFFMSNIVRSRGKAVQDRLLRSWGGFPTTTALRHRDNGSASHRQHRRSRLEQVTGVLLPTAAEEATDPVAADHRYRLAIEQLITQVRSQRADFPLVVEENINYGFRRNLLGLRTFSLILLGACIAFDVLLVAGAPPMLPLDTMDDLTMPTVLLATHSLWALIQLCVVHSTWVKEAADEYAIRLFATLDDPRLVGAKS